MQGVSLADIGRWTRGRWEGLSDEGVSPEGVSTDTRSLTEGQLFVALKGPSFDGHQFVAEAFARGAHAAVVESSWSGARQSVGPLLRVDIPGVEALGVIAREYRNGFDIPVVAVVGSSGKTTTKEMIAAVLEPRFRVLKTGDNENNEVGVPQTLLNLSSDHGAAVIEMGARKIGDIRYLCGIARPTIGVLLNIGSAHLGIFGSVEGVAKAKGELLDCNGNESFVALVNADDRVVAKEAMRTKGRLLGFGLERGSHYSGEGLVLDREGCGHFSLQQIPFELKIPGRHNVYNALASAAVGDQCGLPMADISAALATFEAPAMRSQLLRKKGIVIINDCYNANPDSVEASLQLLADIDPGSTRRRIAVLGDMLELGSGGDELHASIGRFAATEAKVDVLLATGSLSQHTIGAARIAGIADDAALHFAEADEMTRHLRGLLAPGDVVLVKGSRGMHLEGVVDQIP